MEKIPRGLGSKIKLRFPKHFLIRFIVVLVVLFSIPVAVFLVRRSAWFRSRAQLVGVDVFVSPAQQTMPPDSVFKIMVDAKEHSIGFVRVAIVFDPADVQLISELTTSYQLTTVIERTKMAEANSTGRAYVVLGLTPGDTAPTGVFELADFSLTSVSGTVNGLSALLLDEDDMQVVSTAAQELAINVTPAALTLNYLAPTATPLPGPRLYFSDPNPANPQSVGGSFYVDVLLNTGGQNVDGIDARITFDSDYLRVADLASNPDSVFDSYPALVFDNNLGTIDVSANIGSKENILPVSGTDINIATVTFESLAQTALTQIAYDFTKGERNDSNIVLAGTLQNQDSTDILATVTGSNIVVQAQAVTITPTPTSAPTPTATLTLAPTPLATPTQAQGGGSSGTGGSSSSGSGGSSSSGSSGGQSAPRKIGDINGDGKVDIFDLSILLSRYGRRESAAWDLNNDGIISILDLSILLSNWGK